MQRGATPGLDAFSYDDDIVRKFMVACVAWGVIGMLVGVLIALQFANPVFNLGLPFTSFGRLRPLHTNAVIVAFGGNAFFCGCYYSTQRLLKARGRRWSGLGGIVFIILVCRKPER